MAICGYNEKIGKGLHLLLDGMADSMEEKAEINGAIIALEDEIRELDVMISIMQKKGIVQDMFVGLNILAKHLFLEVKKEIIQNPTYSIREVCRTVGDAFVTVIREAEEYRKSLGDTKTHGDNSEIILVANWVNKNVNYPNYN